MVLAIMQYTGETIFALKGSYVPKLFEAGELLRKEKVEAGQAGPIYWLADATRIYWKVFNSGSV